MSPAARLPGEMSPAQHVPAARLAQMSPAARLRRPPRGQTQEAHPADAPLAGGARPVLRRAAVVVDDHPQRRRRRIRAAVQATGRRRPLLAIEQVVAREGLQIGGRGEHQPAFAASVAGLGMLAVRQPLHPIPAVGSRRHDHHLQIRRAVEGGQLTDDRPADAADRVHIADQRDAGATLQPQHPGHAADVALFEEELAQRVAGRGLDLGGRRDLGLVDGHRELDTSGAQSHHTELRVAGATLPHPGRTGDADQFRRCPVAVLAVLPLLARGFGNLVAHLVEAGKVLAAVLLELTPRHLLRGTAPAEQHSAHAHQHDQRKDSKPRSKRPLTRDVHRDDEAEHADDEADRQHDAPDAAGRWDGCGDRRLHRDLAPTGLGRWHARWRHERARGHFVTLTEIWTRAGRQLFASHQRLAFQDS